MENLPLEGIKALELGHTVMGPTWGLVFADMEADGEQVFIGVTSDRHWKRMCETFGLTDHEIRDLHNEGIIEISDTERSSVRMDETAA